MCSRPNSPEAASRPAALHNFHRIEFLHFFLCRSRSLLRRVRMSHKQKPRRTATCGCQTKLSSTARCFNVRKVRLEILWPTTTSAPLLRKSAAWETSHSLECNGMAYDRCQPCHSGRPVQIRQKRLKSGLDVI